MKYVILTLVLGATAGMAAINKQGIRPAYSRQEYCANAHNPDYFKSLFYSSTNQIPWENQGGIMNKGVCWWNSLLTRNVQYLAVFRPDLPPPNTLEVDQIINWLITGNGVVEIPGYHNFSEFSLSNSDKVQRALEMYQIVDGVVGLGFLRGLVGNHIIEPVDLSRMMDETYKLVKESNWVVYQKLQIKGLDAHAWLVVDMQKTPNGYILEVVDSNNPGEVKLASFEHGMKQLPAYDSVPYTSRNDFSYRSYRLAIDNYCKRGITAADIDAAKNVYGN